MRASIKVNREIAYKIFLLVFVAAIIVAGILVYMSLRWFMADTVTAIVYSKRIDARDASGEKNMPAGYYVTFKYSYNGKNYKTEQQVRSLNSYNNGSERTIRVIRKHPERVVNGYQIRAGIILEIFIIFFEVILHLCLKEQ